MKWSKRPTELNLTGLADQIKTGVTQAARESAMAMEAHAKANAPWRDDTGAARGGLIGGVQVLPGGVSIEIAHSVEYGQFLELRWPKDTPPPELEGFTLGFLEAGKYAILWPTVEQEIPQLLERLKGLLK